LAQRRRIPQLALTAWCLAVLCGLAAVYFLFVPVRPHGQPAALGQPRCGSAALPGPDYMPDGDCDRVNWHRYASAGLGAGCGLLLLAGAEETARHRRRPDSGPPPASDA
jgi:hypothetical protein